MLPGDKPYTWERKLAQRSNPDEVNHNCQREPKGRNPQTVGDENERSVSEAAAAAEFEAAIGFDAGKGREHGLAMPAQFRVCLNSCKPHLP